MTDEQNDRDARILLASISPKNQEEIQSDAGELADVLAESTKPLLPDIKDALGRYLKHPRTYSRVRLIRHLTQVLGQKKPARFLAVMLEWHHSKMPIVLRDHLQIDAAAVDFVQDLYDYFGDIFRSEADAKFQPRDWDTMRLNVLLKPSADSSNKADLRPFVELYFERNDGATFDLFTPATSLLGALSDMINEMAASLDHLPKSAMMQLESLEEEIHEWSQKLAGNDNRGEKT